MPPQPPLPPNLSAMQVNQLMMQASAGGGPGNGGRAL